MSITEWLDEQEANQARLAAKYTTSRAKQVEGLNFAKFPGPYFGGKSKAAATVWAALGDVEHYVEPFVGTGAVLLNRPHLANRAYYSETINDADGHVANVHRALAYAPDATAEAASWPVSEVDLMARHIALVRAREDMTSRLRADPRWCDPELAGWWLWGLSCWIGGGWCSGTGPWTEQDGLAIKQGRSGLREPGVDSNRPHLSNDGNGVNHAGLRELGVDSKRPQLGDDGRGVNHAGLREPGVEFHSLTMPELRRWFGFLSARLRHVRILQGDWKRAVTDSAADTLASRRPGGHVGCFLDPPYAVAGETSGGRAESRSADLYAIDDATTDASHVAVEAARWAVACATVPRRAHWRLVYAGFAGDAAAQILDGAGWRSVPWFAAGYLTGGYAAQGADGHQQDRERLWLSPSCLDPVGSGVPAEGEQGELW